jgi:retron-type reverse transcriptase
MIEQVINRRNMHLAYKQVLRNKGSAGVDGMQVRELKSYIDKNIISIALRITKGSCHAQPILGVSIRKSNGKIRLLGVPTVVDRWLQQSVAQAITPFTPLLVFKIRVFLLQFSVPTTRGMRPCYTRGCWWDVLSLKFS